MTSEMVNEMTPDEVISAGLSVAQQMRARIDEMERDRDEQPARLAKAREDAEQARTWSQIEEPWHEQVTALRAHTGDGALTAEILALPNITAKELYGSRLAFDMLDAGEDAHRLEEVKTQFFTMVGGDPAVAFLLFASAMDIVASLVVPQLVEEIETRASNYQTRVMLAEARTKSWTARVAEIRAGSLGVVPPDEPSCDNVDAADDDEFDV